MLRYQIGPWEVRIEGFVILAGRENVRRMFIGEGGLDKKLLGSASRTVASYGLVPVNIGVAQAVDDTTSVQVVRTHLHFHSISYGQLDEMLAQLS